jgi:putative resolvase
MYLSIGEAASYFGVSIVTLRRWNFSHKLEPDFRTPGGHRRYSLKKLQEIFGIKTSTEQKLTVVYARVSSHDQKEDLKRQEQKLLEHVKDTPNHLLISDLGSGINFKKKGLLKLISLIIKSQVKEIILTHKDRLVRFGFELIEKIATAFGTKIKVLEHTDSSFEEDLTKDVLTIITVFSAKLYGKRSHMKK